MTDVLDWLKQNQPELLVTYAVDRSWVWVTYPLDPSVPSQASAIKKLEDYGFIRTKKPGGHPIGASGQVGWFGHNCGHYVPFKRKRSVSSPASTSTTATIATESPATEEVPIEDPELREFLAA